MQFRAFLITALSATAAAQLNSQASELASVAAVLRTAVPSTLLTALTDPAVVSSLSREFALSSYPSWYTPLPSDVKNYINSAANVTDDQSLSSSSSSSSSSTTTTTSSANASTSALLRTSTSSVISAASASETSASQTSSTSTGGAPAPTGAILASMAGVVGVLALAVGL